MSDMMSADYTRPGVEPWWESPNPARVQAERLATAMRRHQGVFAFAVLRHGVWTTEWVA